jgi:Asp-tRNA(Asn)/Glu-tRNA(Gln) amidotransferase A subunit family amidase
MADLVREGLATPPATYAEAQRQIAVANAAMAEVFASTPVILSPAALGRAPAGLSSTGDPAMNAPWTALGTPAISIPLPVDGPGPSAVEGLPLGLQLTAASGHDAALLQAAVAAERAFDAW